MKISTKGKYGLIAMLDLVINSKGTKVSLKEISERNNISVKYLEQLFILLKKAGLVKSIKGANGGYILGKEPENIKLIEIIKTLEGEFEIISTEERKEYDSTFIGKFTVVNVWDRVAGVVAKFMEEITLKQLAEDYESQSKPDVLSMFYI